MLPSLGFQEIILLGILALVVVGPKDLPLLLRKLGRWTARLRGMAQEFRTGFDELARQAELEELRKEVDALRRDSTFTDIRRDLNAATQLPPAPAAPAVTPHDVAHSRPALQAPEAEPEQAEADEPEAIAQQEPDEDQAEQPAARSAT